MHLPVGTSLMLVAIVGKMNSVSRQQAAPAVSVIVEVSADTDLLM